jgi:predicted enzyme related to lactoylglutathione lyase
MLFAMTNIHHAIDYIELAASDLSAAKAFYAGAFGWEFNDYGPEYAGIRGPGGDDEVGGINATGQGGTGPGGPLVLLYSDDLEATAAAVDSAGGTVTDGPYEFPGGRRFHFTDPSGNQLGVWASA